MSLFTKLTEFFLGKKEQPQVVAPQPVAEPVVEAAPVKAAKTSKKSAPVLSFPKQEKAKAQPKKETAKPAPPAGTIRKESAAPKKPAAPKKEASDKVVTAPIVIAPRFNAIDLEKSSKNELLDLAREHGIKVNARMGKATIIAKLVK